jgi:hypothetical protein
MHGRPVKTPQIHGQLSPTCRNERQPAEKMSLPDLRKMIALRLGPTFWEERNPKNQAQKLSAVQHAPQSQEFSSQQREDQPSRGRGRKHRGNRGGRGGNHQAQQAQEPQPGPSTAGPSTFQVSGPMDFAPMASMATSTPLPPHTSVYPTFGAAFTLANRLGVKPTIETLKRLEFVERATDPRPAKRQRKVVDPEEEIDLTWTSDEGSPQNNDAAGPSERYANNQYLE